MLTVVRAVLTVVVTVAIMGFVGLAAYAVLVPDADDPVAPRVDPETARLTIVAMGDSYMSGEGAGAFYRGTDRPGWNKCRRAPTAYPVRVADDLHARLHFVACSGARTYNIGSRFSVRGIQPQVQYKRSGASLQIDTLKRHAHADVVLLSVGGNDALFSDIVARCAGGGSTCAPQAAKWMNNLDEVVQSVLRDLYAEIRATVSARAHIFVVTYPRPFAKGVRSCSAVGMETDEVEFVRTFLNHLNEQAVLAATHAGFDVIDLEKTLEAGGLCSDSGEPTLNGWREQKPDGFPEEFIDVLRGSFHPTEYGHKLMAQRVLDRVRDAMTTSPDQAPATRPPRVPPNAPPGPPPHLPPNLPPPPLPQDANPCTPEATKLELLQFDGGPEPDHVTGARPNSRICYRTYQSKWGTTRADAEGQATVRFPRTVSLGVGGYRRVLYRDISGEWVLRVLQPAPEVSYAAAWITGRTLLLLLVSAVALLATLVGAFMAARWIVDKVLP